MPQFDPSSFLSQIFWLIICFGVLYWIIAKFTIPRIRETIEKRENMISTNLENAEKIRSEAEKTLSDYESKISQALEEAKKEVQEAINDCANTAEESYKELDKELEGQIQSSEERINRAHKLAMSEMQNLASNIAQDATNCISGIVVSDTDAKSVVSRLIKERE